ncbi:DNA methyltransferase [Dermabacteraceae bacterium P7054]
MIDRDAIRRELDKFSLRWRETIAQMSPAEISNSESSSAQLFWQGLLAAFGVSVERRTVFERRTKRLSTGRRGYIDLFIPSVVLGEAKGVGKPLDDTVYQQVEDYLASGEIKDYEYPKYILLTNLETIRVISNSGENQIDKTFSLEELSVNLDTLLFLTGRDSYAAKEQEEASVQAAKIMASLYAEIVGHDADTGVGEMAPISPEEEDEGARYASVFLTRILFLLYGDDSGLWEKDLFLKLIEGTTPDNISGQLTSLFNVLNTPHSRRRNVPPSMANFPYVNGGLFDLAKDGAGVPFFSEGAKKSLERACHFKWTKISPAIFGSLFQMVKSKKARRETGEHYTSEENILKTISPLFLESFQKEADLLCAKEETPSALRDLRAFRDSLAEHIFCDPACGSGNFLTLAYEHLRRIETQLIVEIRRREGRLEDRSFDVTLETKISIGQFYGFEISWWPAKIAETAMFLVDHKANDELAKQLGERPDRLPIEVTAHISHVNALTADWSELLPKPKGKGKVFIFGNPPFLGHATRSADQANELREAWGHKDISRLDYVTGWHAKTLDFYRRSGVQGEFAFVTTNSISQGDQAPRLFSPIFANGWSIKFAHQTFAWDSDVPGKAAVHCVIAGFTKGETARTLWGYDNAKPGTQSKLADVKAINAYLEPCNQNDESIVVEKRSSPLSKMIAKASFGSMPRDDGNLIVEIKDYEEVKADKAAAKYLRKYRGSKELLHGLNRWCLWLENLDPEDSRNSEVLDHRIKAVNAFRRKSTAESTRQMAATPHLFGQRAQPKTSYLCIPRVASEKRAYLLAQRYDSSVIASDATFTVPDEDGLQFALISSSMFIAWQKTIGGRLKSDLRFASSLTWNTFPVPDLSDKQREKIIAAGQEILRVRAEHPDRSLADHYAVMSPDLLKAHNKLDSEVDKAFGKTRRITHWPSRMETLFSHYRNLIAKQG